MLADLGNAWNDDDYDRLLREPGDAGVHRRGAAVQDLDFIERGRAKRECVRDHAVAYNWQSGGLPIVS
ncbi:uncharacterized protein MELLADRAFT_56643 [Melampsora larici-populina 98AG31]|uniref:Uncharacterized protein n=1 Tax=Melampsora larici-populina (strain 98AG31 / pathotype 3-4-7) TaxID=747676 RepID=F4RST7_MELLP|nr:uncharacterized protein MELLADRAFT_56643 [Melampsora larici-populina 98AG31]EGG04550.1 hypothetical protein MELLADRAFT_56643 [Melampsora larici-populina 98AG31]